MRGKYNRPDKPPPTHSATSLTNCASLAAEQPYRICTALHNSSNQQSAAPTAVLQAHRTTCCITSNNPTHNRHGQILQMLQVTTPQHMLLRERELCQQQQVHEQKQTHHRCCCCSRPPPELVLLHLIHQAAGVTQNKCSGAATSDTSQSRQQPIQQGINQSTAVDKTQSSISSALPVNASSPPSCQHIRQAAQPVTAGVTNLP